MKILIAEKVSPAALKVFRDEPDFEIVTSDQMGDVTTAVRDADALVVRSATAVNSKLIDAAQKLRVIGRAGVGVDNVDTDAATRKGIVVMNTPGANAIAVAEHTLGLMLSLARFIPRADQTTRAGKWEKKSLQGTELRSNPNNTITFVPAQSMLNGDWNAFASAACNGGVAKTLRKLRDQTSSKKAVVTPYMTRLKKSQSNTAPRSAGTKLNPEALMAFRYRVMKPHSTTSMATQMKSGRMRAGLPRSK